MAQECRKKMLEREPQLLKSEFMRERLKDQKLQALVKTEVARHFEARSKEKTKAVDLKLKKLAKLKGEVGAKDRVDGFEGKISALEMANLKLSAQIEDLILETKREIYGTESTALKPNIQDQNTGKGLDKKPLPNSQLKNGPPRTKNKNEIRHPPSKQDNPESPCKVTSLPTHENKVDRRRPATAISVTIGANKKVVTKHSEGVCCSVNKNVSKTVHPANQNPPKRQEREVLQRPSPFVSMEFQHFQHHLSDNLNNTSPINENQTSPCFSHSPVPQNLSTCRLGGSVDIQNSIFPGQSLTPILDADKKAPENAYKEICTRSSKQLTPRAIKINRMTCHEPQANNQISMNLTHLVGKKEPIKMKSNGIQPRILSPYSEKMDEETSILRPKIDGSPRLVGKGEESHQEGDFRRQPQVSPCANKSEDKRQEDYLRQVLLKVKPHSAKTDSGSSRNSSSSLSPKNDKSRPWYERLPIPDVELFDDSPDFNNAFSTDSDSSGKIPVKVCSKSRREYDAWTYLGDQTALMPRPVIRKSCKFVKNIDSLSLTDGDTE